MGPFTLALATPLDDVGPDAVLEPAQAVGHLPSITVDPDLAGAVAVGKVLDDATLGQSTLGDSSLDALTGDGPWAVLDAGGSLLAVYERHGQGRVKPAVVLAGAG